MKSNEFCYWLQGLFELGDVKQLDEKQTKLIKQHLALVFKHDLDAPDPTGELQAIHDGEGPPHLPELPNVPKPRPRPRPPRPTVYRC